jgi:branched-chain amino acid transport system ATP-binding protein
MLKLAGISGGYGKSKVLFDVSLEVKDSEVVCLLGRNGMGKTTTIRTLMGLLPAWGGSIRLRGQEIVGLSAARVARLGIGLVPEGRQIFPNLTVYENLVATAANRNARKEPWTVERINELFPQLRERRTSFGNLLSGGEQQMLAIGRAMMTNPDILILDEATEGLAPIVRSEIWECLARLRAFGQSILIIDKHLKKLQRLADRFYVIEKGRIVWTGSAREVEQNYNQILQYMAV